VQHVGLVSKSREISVAFGTASFFMRDGDRTVRVDVDQGVLTDLQGPPLKTKADYRERLTRHWARFTRIARRKYGAGLCRAEVRVLVVHIAAADMAVDGI
jgi:hypothetical protein